MLLAAPLAAAFALARAGLAWPIAVAIVTASTALVVALLERKMPYRAEWNRSHGDVRTDTLHAIFGMIPIPIVFRALAFGALTAAATFLAARIGHPVWPSSWPLGAQVVVALLVAELGQYWVHRLGHERALLWRLHSVHHSVERLYWLNAGRFHPLDTLLQHAAEMTPLVILGATPEALALYTVFTSANGLLRHANVDMRTKAFDWLLSTADLHRWHHSIEIAESNANYGANLIVWDVVFGTRRVPARTGPATLGLRVPFPRTFLAQLAAPFR